MAATATASAGPRYAPEDPTLPKPWRGLVDGKTGYLYFWNPETNVTQNERPQQASQGPPRDEGDDMYGRGSNGGSKIDVGSSNLEGERPALVSSNNASSGMVSGGPAALRGHGPADTGSGLSSEAYCLPQEITVIGDNVPPPFTSFEATGSPSEILRKGKRGTSLVGVQNFLGQLLARESRGTFANDESHFVDNDKKRIDLIKDKIICLLSGGDVDQINDVVATVKHKMRQSLLKRSLGSKLSNVFSHHVFKRTLFRFHPYPPINTWLCGVQLYEEILKEEEPDFGCLIGGHEGIVKIRVVGQDKAISEVPFGEFAGCGCGSKYTLNFLQDPQNGWQEVMNEEQARDKLVAALVYTTFRDRYTGGRIVVDILRSGTNRFKELYNNDAISAYHHSYNLVTPWIRVQVILLILEDNQFTRATETFLKDWIRNRVTPPNQFIFQFVGKRSQFKLYRLLICNVNQFMSQMGDMSTNLADFEWLHVDRGHTFNYDKVRMFAAAASLDLLERIKDQP